MIREEESTPTYRWVVIGSLTASVGTTLTILFTLGLLLPDMSKDLGLSPSQQGWLASSVVFGNLLFAIPTNLWLSRYRPWRVASLAFLLVGLFTLLQGWSPLLAVLIIGRIGTGLSFMASQAPRALLIQQWTPRRKLAMTNGIVFGAIDLIMGGAFFLIPILMGWVDGWRNTLYVLAGISLFLAAFWMIAGRERITPGYQERMLSQEQTPLMTILRYPQLWFMGLAMIGAMVGQTAFQTFWPTLAQDELGLSAVVAGSALGLVSIVAAPIDMMVNIVPSLVRRQPLVLAVCGIINTFTMLGLLYADSTPLVLLLSVVKGFSFSFFPVLMVMVYQLPGIKPREVALGIAVMQTCIWIGAGIGPLVVGFLEEATGDLRFALLVTAFTPLILVASAILLQSRRLAAVRPVPAPATRVHKV